MRKNILVSQQFERHSLHWVRCVNNWLVPRFNHKYIAGAAGKSRKRPFFQSLIFLRIECVFIVLNRRIFHSYLQYKNDSQFQSSMIPYRSTLASAISAVFLVAASYGGCDETLVVILLILSIFGQGFDSVGIDLSAYDLAPNYIGPLTATVFIMSAAASIIAPYTVGVLTPHVRNTDSLFRKVE